MFLFSEIGEFFFHTSMEMWDFGGRICSQYFATEIENTRENYFCGRISKQMEFITFVV